MLRRSFTGFLCSLPFLGFTKKENCTIESINKKIKNIHLLKYDFSKGGNNEIRVFSQEDKQGKLDIWFIGDKSGMIPHNFTVFVKNSLFPKNFQPMNIGKLIKEQNPKTKILVRLIKDSSTKIQYDFIEV